MPVLTTEEANTLLKTISEWKTENSELTRTFHFKGFRAALHFVNQVADLAEEVNHHPAIDIRYRHVTIRLTTYDAGGLTEKDFHLAEAMDKLV